LPKITVEPSLGGENPALNFGKNRCPAKVILEEIKDEKETGVKLT
jgi:hypothetical protein